MFSVSCFWTGSTKEILSSHTEWHIVILILLLTSVWAQLRVWHCTDRFLLKQGKTRRQEWKTLHRYFSGLPPDALLANGNWS